MRDHFARPKLFAIRTKWWLERRLLCMLRAISRHLWLAHSYTRNVYMCACLIMNVITYYSDNCVSQLRWRVGGYKRSGALAVEIKVFAPCAHVWPLAVTIFLIMHWGLLSYWLSMGKSNVINPIAYWSSVSQFASVFIISGSFDVLVKYTVIYNKPAFHLITVFRYIVSLRCNVFRMWVSDAVCLYSDPSAKKSHVRYNCLIGQALMASS